MFLEELSERRNGDVKGVRAIMLLEVLELGGTGDALGFLEDLELRGGVRIDKVRQRAEGLLVVLVEESALLEEERDICLLSNLTRKVEQLATCTRGCLRKKQRGEAGQAEGTYLVAHKGADIGSASICDGKDLDELGVVDGAGLLGREGGLEVDAPVGAQPDEGLEGDDCADPDEGPLLGLDVFVVELSTEIEAQEDGPYYHEGPDVGVAIERQWPPEVGRLDLRVVDERRHGWSNKEKKGMRCAYASDIDIGRLVEPREFKVRQ